MIHSLPGLLALSLSFALLPNVGAHETTVAIGYVTSAGTLLSGANPYGGIISVDRQDTGEFHITLDALGAFPGAGIGDFMVHSTIRSAAGSDRSSVAEIESVSADSISVVVYVSDVEDSGNLDVALPVNSSFQFVIHQISNGLTMNPWSRYLFATGAVTSNGTLLGAAAADGSIVTTERTGVGDYTLTCTSPVGFGGYQTSQYLVFATTRTSNLLHDTVAVGTVDSFANNQIFVTVNTSDVQTANDDDPVAEDHAFQFTIYRTLEAGSAGVAESRLLLGMASVDGSNGLLRRGAVARAGGFVTAERSGVGIYRVVFHAPGSFAGRSLNEFSVQTTVNRTALNDDIAAAIPFLIDADTLTIEVRINDVETNGVVFGQGVDADFFLTVHDNRAISQPDLRIGKKRGLTKMKGNGRYNTSGAGQKLKAFAGKRGRFYFAVENDGNITDSLRVTARAARSHLRNRTFRLTGGRKNVTARVATSGHVLAARPSGAYVFESRNIFISSSNHARAKIRFASRSENVVTSRDAAVANVSRSE